MTDKKIAALLLKQHTLTDSMKENVRIFKERGVGTPSEGYIKAKLAGLESLWNDFKSNHKQLLTAFTDETLKGEEYFKNQIYSQTEDLVCEYVAYYQDMLPDRNAAVDTVGNDVKPKIKLPTIPIPIFDGNLQDWCNFRNLFRTLIHDRTDISDLEKLQYLKGSLKGEASNIVKHFDITAPNYKTAWKLLADRYENPRLMIDALITKITSLPTFKSESISAFKNIVDTVNECLHSLSNLNVNVTSWDPLLLHLLVPKLPASTIKDWEKEVGASKTLPPLSKFLEFLTNTFQTMESSKRISLGANTSPASSTATSKIRSFFTNSQNGSLCLLCKANHSIRNCTAFLQMTVQGRLEFLKSKLICRNCLSIMHSTAECSSSRTCKHCQRRHHSLLHFPTNRDAQMHDVQSPKPASDVPGQSLATNPSYPTHQPSSSVNHAELASVATNPLLGNVSSFAGTLDFPTTSREVRILATVVVSVSYRGIAIPVRALVDPGSQVTFVTTRVAQTLRATTRPAALRVSGLGGMPLGSPLSRTTLDISSIAVPGFTCTVEMFTLPKLTQLLPPNKVHLPNLGPYELLPLADPHFNNPSSIDMLLGVDVYAHILMPGLHSLSSGLKLQATRLGWIIFGSLPEASILSTKHDNVLASFHAHIENQNALKRFWELETVPEDPGTSPASDPCEVHYRTNTVRLPDGRYQVKLPFRDNSAVLGRSGHIARAAFLRMENRLMRSPSLYQLYQDCFREYLELGQMQLAKNSEESFLHPVNVPQTYQCFYLPHHGVVKESSTTKLRVVFNASQKTDNGNSLNDLLHTGPRLQSDIIIILLQWRLYPIALTADIAKMYRQVLIHPSDQPYQRVLWRPNPTLPIAEYELKTVTFGITTAPFLALRTLHQLASDERKRFPLAAQQLKENFYVDDYLGGAFDVATAAQSIVELRSLLNAGGFHLRKWISSHEDALKMIPSEDRESLGKDQTVITIIKTLGVGWNPIQDLLQFTIPPFPPSIAVCKRSVLSWIASLYDPLGILAPVVITCKLFMQRLWLTGLPWDDPIDGPLLAEWNAVIQYCYTPHPLTVPRWLRFNPQVNMELHGFCDASKRAYAAVVYLRVIDQTGCVSCRLVLSKTRVAPTKTVTIPRLELCGAVLLVKMLQYIRRQLPVLQLPFVLWTDSQVVLAWLRKEPETWTTFVANRVAFIQSHSNPTNWSFVCSSDNPADIATRGLSMTHLYNNTLWWSGPCWLSHPTYDKGSKPLGLDSILMERRSQIMVSCQVVINIPWLSNFSSLTRLIRVTAYILRFIHSHKPDKAQSTSTSLSSTEIKDAKFLCIRFVQQSCFAAELQALKKKYPLPGKSPLLSLNPFVDPVGILRVGGRLANSGLSFAEKHPIILPSLHPFTTLVIRHAHAQTLHGGTEMTATYIRATYWILHTRSTVRKILHQCTICFRYNRHSSEQLMADFPRERVSIARPFTYTGVDYAGPVVLKPVGIRSTKTFKGYIALFVCFTTKAYHLELVSDLTRDAFLAAFHRFIARRGLPHTVFSDCGTNFVGAYNLLERYRKDVINFCSTRGVDWRFIPPAAPHFGGLWEAGVKLVKAHLKKVLGATILTFEEYATLLTQVEACLNSRPLCPISSDPRDYAALTPGHFLTGSNLSVLPQPDLSDVPSNHLHRWQRIQQLYQTFWKRWSTDYLSRQQPRIKWKRTVPNLQESDLVLIRDDRLAPLHWRLGRVVSTIGGPDHLVRVAVVRTADGLIKRPVTKLFKIPSQTSETENRESGREVHEM